MKINLAEAGKRYNREWIFRNFSYEFITGQAYAITGPNGSGKSTLLQCIGGMLLASEGKVAYHHEAPISTEAAFQKISFSAPYLEVVEEMTLSEFIDFHRAFKPVKAGFSNKQLADIMQLGMALHKQIRYYSSGMKQRVRLLQAVFSDTPVLLLDEPCSNLDKTGIELYHHLINTYCQDRLIIISSNDPVEYSFANAMISIADYKNPAAKAPAPTAGH